MHRLAATAIALVVFVGFYYADDHLASSVSSETVVGLSAPSIVKDGVSSDGKLVIARQETAPAIPPRAKSPNHTRTLRAYFAPDRGGRLTLFVESVKPKMFYALSGSFTPSDMYPALYWSSDSVLVFFGATSSGDFGKFSVDVSRTTLTEIPVTIESEVLGEYRPVLDTAL